MKLHIIYAFYLKPDACMHRPMPLIDNGQSRVQFTIYVSYML